MSAFTDPNGFAIFSLPHIFMLILIAAACVVVSYFYRRSYKKSIADQSAFLNGKPYRHPAALAVGIIIFAGDIFHYIYLAVSGMLDLYMLPLHLCGMSVYVVFIHCLCVKDSPGQLLYALFLPGGSCALLFPDWGYLPFFSYFSMRCFIMHGLVVMYIIMQTAAGVIRPKLSSIWKPVLFLCIISPLVLWLNSRIEANYMFLSFPANGSPLEFLYSLADGSHGMYLFYFGILAIVGMTIMYLPFAIYHAVNKNRPGK